MLAPVPVGQLQGDQLSIYNRAASEYVESQTANAERPEAQLNLGNYYAAKGEIEKASAAYTKAIELEDIFVPAYVNLADLFRAQQKDDEAEKILNKAIAVAPDNADVHFALALLLVRKQQSDKAVNSFQRAAELDISNARYAYVYAVALNSAGKTDQAIELMQDAHNRFPGNADILSALIAFHRDAGNNFAAQAYMKKLQKLNQ